MPTSLVGNSATTSPTPSPILPQGGAKGTPSTDKGKLNQNFDQFLLLLTTQLKNQDPLSPMDSAEFTNQLVSFSSVEQQIKTNENLAKMVASANINQTTLGLGYIGLKVNMEGDTFKFSGNEAINTSYKVPEEASLVKISVLDSQGNLVYSQDGEIRKGTHNFIWNGIDQSGQPVAPGTYELRVGAIDREQKALTVTTTVPGRVEGIQTADDGEVMLIINDQEVAMSTVKKATL